MSFSFVLAEDCVWRKIINSDGLYNTLYEDSGTVYMGMTSKILYSEDDGETFKTYAEKSGISSTYLNKIAGRFVSGYYEGLFKVDNNDKFTKFLDPDPMQTFQMIEYAGSTFYGTDGWGKIVYEQGIDTSSTEGEVAEISGVTKITALGSHDNQIWVAGQDTRLYYTGNPSNGWSKTSRVGSQMTNIGNLNFIGNTVYVTAEKSDGKSVIRYNDIDNLIWSDYPAQIPGATEYADLIITSHGGSYALVRINNDLAKVYKKTVQNTWSEYGTGLDKVITKGKDLLKMSNGQFLVIGNSPVDKNALAKCKPNNAPIVDAGEDITTFVGYEVTLHGTAEDSDGDEITSYDWEQPGAVIVDLVGSDSDTATFTPKKAGTYVFQFYATDDFLKKSKPAEVIVKVVSATKYYVELDSETDHFSWYAGNDYDYGTAYINNGGDMSDFAFKVYAGDEEVINTALDLGGYDIYVTKPKQSFLMKSNEQGIEFDKASVFVRSGNFFNLPGDTITLKITDTDGDIKAEASQFVEKSLTGQWVEFVFDAGAVDAGVDDAGSDDSSDSSSSSSSSSTNKDYPELETLQGEIEEDPYASVSNECTMDSHCDEGEACVDNECVSEETPITLNDDNGCVRPNDCAVNEFCNKGKCDELVCKTGQLIVQHICVDRNNLFGLPYWLVGVIAAIAILVLTGIGLGGYFAFRKHGKEIDVKVKNVKPNKAKPKKTKNK